MGFGSRMAGSFATGQGRKTNALIGTGASNFDAIGTARAVISQFHPGIDLVDNAVGLVEQGNKLTQSKNVSDTILSGTNATGAAGTVLGVKAPALGAALSQAGPLSGALSIGAGVGKWMQDNLPQYSSSSGRGAGRSSFKGK